MNLYESCTKEQRESVNMVITVRERSVKSNLCNMDLHYLKLGELKMLDSKNNIQLQKNN